MKKIRSFFKKPHISFAVLGLILISLYWMLMILNRSTLLTTYFLNDYTDTNMDYYNMLAIMYDANHPYRYNANYPALCFLLWRILFHMIPYIPDTSDGFFLRTYMPATLGFILCNSFVLIIIYEALKQMILSDNIAKYLLPVSLLFSGPLIYAFERGNMILLSFAFSLLFFLLYNSEKKMYRFIGYLCLSIAASIKIYPALFGLLILRRRKLGETMLAVITGLVTFILPFFCFEGLKSIKDFLHGIIYANSIQGNIGMGYNFSFKNLIRIFSTFVGWDIIPYYTLLLIVTTGFCLGMIFLSSRQWQQSLGIVLMIIWIPEFSYTYTLIFLIIPIVQFLNDYNNFNSHIPNWIITLLFIITQVPLALPSLAQWDILDAKFPLTYPTLIINLAICGIALLTWTDILLCIIHKHFTSHHKEHTT